MNELKFQVIFNCKEEEIEEVKKKLSQAVINNVRRMEGLFQTSWIPWSKTYYFSVEEVKEIK
tara:strand:- start:14271 stop:14456 length:186 start_codon:yes stop_codon:yes gene_type:complete